jgi:4-diphosphocytidyl-2C-methyl-D-erythritol kinase
MGGFSLAPERAEGAANDFERIVFPRFPELARIKRQLAAAGAQQTALSGSGSTIYALFRQPRSARLAARKLGRHCAQIFVARTVSRERYARALGLPAARLTDGQASRLLRPLT